MAESRQGLSTLGEDDERSNNDANSGIIYHDDQQDEFETLDELEELAPSVKVDANKFRMLSDNVENSLAEIDNSMFELLELKDNLLLQFLPPNVSARISLVVSRLYRAYSLSQIPINELVRLVQLYSQSFDIKSVALKKLYENNEMKKRMLNIALQKLSSLESSSRRHQQLRMINHWEKMYINLALPRSNGRKWKFRLTKFRETSQMGYEHVIEWLSSNVARPSSASDVSKDEQSDDEDADELADPDRIETSGDIISVPEIDEHQIDQGSEFGDEIESDNDGSFLSSAGKQKPKRIPQPSRRKDSKRGPSQISAPAPPVVITKVDVDIQVQPTQDDQQTSTGDILSTKSLLIRVYRPVGLLKTKFQCTIHAHGEKYTTQLFTFDKSTNSKDDNTKGKGRLAASRASKVADSKTKKRPGDSSNLNDIDINVIDKQQSTEFIIPMPSVLKSRSLFETEIDPDAILIDMFGDDKLCGTLVLSPEDLRMLDLPNLSSPTSAPLITIDDSASNPAKAIEKTNQTSFDQQSTDLYKSWTSRTPQAYAVYNDKREPIAKLPLHLFWYHQVEITHATKCTMTAPLEVRSMAAAAATPAPPPPPPIEIPVEVPIPVITPPAVNVEDNKEPSPTEVVIDNGQIEALKASYEDRLAKMQESYQAEIRRLTKLLNEMPSRRSSQMGDLSELDETLRESTQEQPSEPTTTRRQVHHPIKREISGDNQPPPVYGKNLPKNFLDRYHMFMERSTAHRHQLSAKIETEIARETERQMEIQHRLHRADQNEERYDDLCLPAVFMPFRSGNVYNPRAYRFFHSIGTTDPRLTQTPSIFKLPPLPSGSVSVLNLFELSRCYDAANAKDRSADKTTTESLQQPVPPPTTQTSN